MASFWAAIRNEFSKFARQKFPYLGMAAVILLALLWPRSMRQIGNPEVKPNGFEMTIKGAISAVTSVIPLFAVIFSSVLVASETAGGTYRNILSRPIRRVTFLTAKILFAYGYVLLLVFLYVLFAVPVIRAHYPFGAVRDGSQEIYTFGRILGISLGAGLLTLIPLFAITSYGILVSTASKSLTSGLGVGVGLFLASEPLKYLIYWGDWHLSDYFFTSYLDTALKIANQAAGAFDYEWLPGGWWASELGWSLTLSLGCMAVFLGVSYWIFLRRDLNFS